MAKTFGDLALGTPEQGELFDRARSGLLAVMAAISARLNGLDEDAPLGRQLRAERRSHARRLRQLHPTDPQLVQLVAEIPAMLREARGEGS